MSKAKIKKITLVISRSDVAAVLREIILLGCVEVIEPDKLLEDANLAAHVRLENADIESCRSDFECVTTGIDILNKFVPSGDRKSKVKQKVTFDHLLYELDTESCLTLSKTLETLDDMIPSLQEDEKDELIAKVVTASEMREAMQMSYDHYSIRLAFAQTVEKLLGTDYTLILSGWIDSAYEVKLIQALSQYACAWEISKPSAEEYDRIPVMHNKTRFRSKVTERDFNPLTIVTKYVDVI